MKSNIDIKLEQEVAEWLKELMRNSFCRFPQDESEYDKKNREHLFNMLSVKLPD